ncbi:hypothetical protein [Fibrobacter succinogenes]|uniref:hypothetical protein n=1 Tax=Fibrobacter succinogenes TaxID=833 RepID=UPI0015680CF5|nr:hypothetical protein [Fibrobacter succinogenes]
MSSKKATSKAPAKASASEKKAAKPAPKKAAPAKAAAPAKKVAAKPAPAKKPAAKAAPALTKKAPVKAAPAKAAPAKKPVAKKEVPAKKESVKAVKAAPAPTKKPAAKPAAEVSKKPAPAKKVEPAVEAKAPAAPKKAVEKEVVKEVEKKIEKEPVQEVVEQISEKIPEKVPEKAPEKAKIEAPEKVEVKKASVKSDYPYAVLLEGGKKPCKFIMFVEIDEQEERANKKKVTSEMKNLEKKPTSAIRHKISLAEETQEELTERILKELEEQNAAFTREAATQICTRCNKNLVSPEFWVDKHLGYCEECAAILHLGQSKEARKVEYQLGAMGGDSLDEVEDDDIEGPDAAALKEAEEELADFDD